MSETTAERAALWRAGDADDLVWTRMDDAFIVYHRPSGKTHFLNAATADLLAHVLTTPRTARSAADELAAREDAAVDSNFISVVAESLFHLEHLGLIGRCEP
jgi:PqqD family protein of HPr-rel-A system